MLQLVVDVVVHPLFVVVPVAVLNAPAEYWVIAEPPFALPGRRSGSARRCARYPVCEWTNPIP